MPCITLAQELIQGQATPHQLATVWTFVGWLFGVGIIAAIGGAVAVAIEQSQSERLRALAIGLTLPATLTAIVSSRQAEIHVGALENTITRIALISIAEAAEATNVTGREIMLVSDEKPPSSLVLINDKGEFVGSVNAGEANSFVKISDKVSQVLVPTSYGILAVEIPENPGKYVLKLQRPSTGFGVGLRSAFGSGAQYSVTVSPVGKPS